MNQSKTYPLLIPKRFVVLLSGLGIALLMGAFRLQYLGGNGETYLWVGLAVSLVVFVIVVRDLFLNPIRNKLTWTLILTVFSIFGAFVYLLFREQYLAEKIKED